MECKQCTTGFKITEQDRQFYEQISPVFDNQKYQIPDPTLCPDCRRQRRLVFRNERNLYKRKCNKTEKDIISMYAPEADFPVYASEVWFGDDWDPLEYGQEYDFNRPFFEQFQELQKKVPKLSLVSYNNINCDYCNLVGDSKNCYLIYGSVNCEDCFYGNPYVCKNCVDILVSRNCQFCYECIDSENLHQCFYCQNCNNSNDLQFCFDVDGSNDCFLCTGLRQAEYHILNQPYSKEEYQNKVAELKKKDVQELFDELKKLKEKTPVKFMTGTNNENVIGDNIFNSKNCRNLFYGEKCEEVHRTTQILEAHHCMDIDNGEIGNFIYENSGFYKSTYLQFCHWCWDVANLYYCSTCALNTKYCFGCISLQHKEYCILNKQYTKNEYEKLVPKIIEHMRTTGEWGEFFPVSLSPFGYNETVVQEYFPMTKNEALAKGWKWRDEENVTFDAKKTIPAERLPDTIDQTPNDILDWAIKCKATGSLFRIQKAELEFYRKMNLPIPHFHPNERHRRRMALRNPRRLWSRNCSKCQTSIQTTYSPERPEMVYCEKCYLSSIYD